jgi:hypothetical protein
MQQRRLVYDRRRAHCWECGPPEPDGCSTTCMLWDGHQGEHEWTRDDGIRITFAPALNPTERE